MDPLVNIGPEVDREHLVEKLICQNALITGFFNSVPGTFIVLDSRWHIIYVNGDAEKILSCDKASLIGKPIDAVFQEDGDPILTSQVVESLIRENEDTMIKYSIALRKWLKISAYQSHAGIFIRLEDVTHEKMVNHFLILNEFSVNQAGDMVLWIMTGGRIIYGNISARHTLKYSLEELVKMKISQIDPSFAGGSWNKFAEDLKKAKTAVYESGIKTRDGSTIPVESTYNYLRFHREDYFIAFVRDITARKQAENELRKLNRVVEEGPVIIVITDLKGDIEYVNPQFTRITGYTFEEVKGKNPGILKSGYTPPDEYKRLRDTILSGKEWRGEFRNKKKNGDLYWESAIISPLKDARGQITGFMALKEDITERKRADEEMKTAKQQAELYLDLMGHDINNLNQIALGYLELADQMVEDDGVRELVKKPLEAIQSSSKLIDNVRKLQKLKTGELKIEAIDVGAMLAELRDQYSNVPGRVVAIDYTPCQGCRVMANQLLRDVFSNLIGNSIKHSGPSRPVRIGLRLDRVGDDGREYCRAVVEDDGPGIPDAVKEKVFDRIGKNNAKASGKGLGLYLVKTLVEDFHGTVHVEDRVKGDHTRGSRFVVKLPAVEYKARSSRWRR